MSTTRCSHFIGTSRGTPSKLLALSLSDAVGDRRTQNQPGTTDEYPNWRVPLCGPKGRQLLLEDVFRDRRAATLADAMHAAIGGDGDMKYAVIAPVDAGVTADPSWMAAFARHVEVCGFDEIVAVEHTVLATTYDSVYPYDDVRKGRPPRRLPGAGSA